MFEELFARFRQTPAAQGLLRRVESGGALTCGGITGSSRAFLAAWLHREFPNRPIVLVAENLKAQETLHQDVETWLGSQGSQKSEVRSQNVRPLFFPAWETLPHEDKLPHADVISERLETLVSLMRSARGGVRNPKSRASGTHSALDIPHSGLVTTSISALLQRTFPPAMLTQCTRTLRRGDRVDPLDLIEWLEENGYDSEAQVSAKGDIALRGGIVDVFPLTSPWPVRLEFFGDELESLRSFDPVTQVSREGGELAEIILPPAGELGVLKREVARGVIARAPAGSMKVLACQGDAGGSPPSPSPRPSPAGRGGDAGRVRPGDASGGSSVAGAAPSPSGRGAGVREEGRAHKVGIEVIERPAASSQQPAAGLATLLDYLPDETIFILCDPEAIERHAEEYGELVPANDPFIASWEELRGELLRRGLTVMALLEDEGTEIGGAAPSDAGVDADASDSMIVFSTLEAYRPITDQIPAQEVALAQRHEFFLQLQRWLRSGFAVHVICNNDGEAQRFGEVWQEAAGGAPSPMPKVSLGTLARGFLCEAARLVVVTDAEVFGRYKMQRPRRMKSAHAIAARSALDIDFSGLEEGDYVVHLQHGIGRFKGLKLLPTGKPGRERHHLDPAVLRPVGKPTDPVTALPHPGPLPLGEGASPAASVAAPHLTAPNAANQSPQRSHALPLPAGEGRGEGEKPLRLHIAASPPRTEEGIECLVLEYAPSDTDCEPPKLYVPVTEAHLISKYVGAGKSRPPLNTLGGKRWEKTKQQAERAVRDLASDLLAIQAKRATQPGHSFGPDTPWQREFESSFLFEETPDQLRAIEEAKHDLEIPKPMDRLICGDVGFGKTEVAIRAAFKAVMGGKQVAILVPTTVLAQQHYNTFRERMADYPVRVELLSRFRTRKEQVKIVEQLAAGAVDIVIGTHRLVQSDVTFKELGLVVIDEEQRFGVLHKEKFKLLRTHVDVLTLSATPIPRTLYLALTGARDMSTIQTPPQDRLPVETIVEHYDERVIRDAILRELGRGGQVFFLHNRVTTIEAMRSRLQLLVPHARVVVGHGQMSGDELEDVMTKFVNGEADVLLSTTIIESGLDIPNANTLIIDRADRFGLSQLYQLRGRVGRYKHQAFAYLLLPRHARLLTDVRKRMSAIKQYAQLGSGFKIAMRDLEIRGAGNLLGAQQSGHITAVGFELYCNLLKQSVAALKGEKVKQRTNAALRLDFLKLHAVDEEKSEVSALAEGRAQRTHASISMRRDSDVWVQPDRPKDEAFRIPNSEFRIPSSGAFLPPAYIAEPQHRIEAYRKLAQAETKADVEALARELKDRYGKPPKPVELLLLATELKLLAGERGLDAVETKGGKLMLHRRGDFIQLGGKFPRLTKTEPLALLKEIKRLLLSL